MKGKNYFKQFLTGVLILVACIAAYFGSTTEVSAATASYFKAYQKADFEETSKHYELKVNGQKVDVVSYYYDRFDYAHLAFEGTTTFEIKSKHGDIQFYNVSPHSYKINAKVSGDTITFDLSQKESRYLVIKTTAGGIQKELFIACDPKLDLEKPDTSKDNVVDIVKDYKIETNYNKADGKKNSDKINQAIKDVSKKGGGTVYFPGNTTYKFVTIDTADNVTLYLDDGAVLRGSGKRSDYDWNDSGANGRQSKRRDIKITSKNFSIVGSGMVDTNSEILCLPQKADKDLTGSDKGVPDITQDEYRKKYNKNYYPNGWDDFRKGIVDSSSSAKNIVFKGVTFKDATGWSLHVANATDVTMTNVKLILDYSVVHADGYDIASCQGVEITNCLGITGDDTFCPKGSNGSREMKNYLFKDCVSYARGGAGCKIGMQAQSKTTNIEFNNIDVIQGYRGFCIAHDDGQGEFSNIRFIDIRTEKIWINNTGNVGGQFRPAPFTIWALNDGGKSGNVHDVEVTRCSFEDCASLTSVIKGDLAKGVISNVKFTDLVMNGRTITKDNYEEKINLRDGGQKLIDIGSNTKKDTITFESTTSHRPSKVEYEGEFGTYSNGAKTTGAGNCSMTRKAGSLGKKDGKDRTVAFRCYVMDKGEHTVDIYACVNGTRELQIYVNDKKAKKVKVTGKSFDYPVKVTTTLDLNAGNNTIKFGNPDGEAPDLDKFVIFEEGGTDGGYGEVYSGTVEVGAKAEAEWGTVANEAEIQSLDGGAAIVTNLGGSKKGAVSYEFTAPISGKHKMDIYYCTGEERQFNVVVNGKEYKADCPSTGSYTTTNTTPVTVEVELKAGTNTIEFTGVGDAYAPNLDAFQIHEREIKAIKLEAEKGVLGGEAKISEDAPGILGWIGGEGNGTATFNVNCDTAGKRIVKLYYATGDNRDINFSVNGKDNIHTATSNGSWTEAGTPLMFEVEVVKGNNVIQLAGADGKDAPNVDSFELEMTDDEIKKENSKPNGPGTEGAAAEDGEAYQVPLDKVVLSQGATLSGTGDSQKIEKLGGEDKGTASFNMYADEAKKQKLSIAYTATEASRLNVIVNGKEYTVDCSATEDGEQVVEVEVSLKEGANTIQLTGVDDKATPVVCGVSSVLTENEEKQTNEIINKDVVEKEKLTLNKNSASITVGATLTLTVTAGDKEVVWSSSDEAVAVVSETGEVKAIAEGTAVITATAKDGIEKATCEVTVLKQGEIVEPEIVSVEDVTLNEISMSLEAGETSALTATVTPDNATNKAVVWTTSDEGVATVKDGVVTAVAEGTATITVTTTDGGKIATCKVTVKEEEPKEIAVIDVQLNKASLKMVEGESTDLTVAIAPADATNQEVVWSTSDEKVATVKDGKVTAVAEGTAIITVAIKDGDKEDTCEVTVTKKEVTKPDTPLDNDNEQKSEEVPKQPEQKEADVQSITITGISNQIAAGRKIDLVEEVVSKSGKNTQVVWSSSDERYATVDQNGRVSLKKAGKNRTVVITATATDGSGVKGEYTIKIMPKAIRKIVIKAASSSVTAGKSVRLKASVNPAKKVYKTLEWSSSNEKYATVTSKGVVKTKKAGKGKTVKITARALDGSNKKAVIKIKIK